MNWCQRLIDRNFVHNVKSVSQTYVEYAREKNVLFLISGVTPAESLISINSVN